MINSNNAINTHRAMITHEHEEHLGELDVMVVSNSGVRVEVAAEDGSVPIE